MYRFCESGTPLHYLFYYYFKVQMQSLLNPEAVSDKSIHFPCSHTLEQAYEKYFLFWLSLFEVHIYHTEPYG